MRKEKEWSCCDKGWVDYDSCESRITCLFAMFGHVDGLTKDNQFFSCEDSNLSNFPIDSDSYIFGNRLGTNSDSGEPELAIQMCSAGGKNWETRLHSGKKIIAQILQRKRG